MSIGHKCEAPLQVARLGVTEANLLDTSFTLFRFHSLHSRYFSLWPRRTLDNCFQINIFIYLFVNDLFLVWRVRAHPTFVFRVQPYQMDRPGSLLPCQLLRAALAEYPVLGIATWKQIPIHPIGHETWIPMSSIRWHPKRNSARKSLTVTNDALCVIL